MAGLVALGYFVWNYGYRQGTTGSSIGKSVLKFKVVSENTGEPIGFGLSVLRQIAHVVDAVIFYVGYLFPLWDAKRQTLADKMMATVCLPLDRTAADRRLRICRQVTGHHDVRSGVGWLSATADPRRRAPRQTSTIASTCRDSRSRRRAPGPFARCGSRVTPQPVRQWRGQPGSTRRGAAATPPPPLMAASTSIGWSSMSDHGDFAKAGLATKAIHAGYRPDPATGAVNAPIYASSTFAQDGVGGLRGGFEYARTGNPTRAALEAALAAVEEGRYGRAFSSGMAATDCVLRAMLRPGDHVVIPDDAYGGTFRLIDKVFTQWDVQHTPVALSDVDAVRAAITPQTRLIWVETPTNPLLSIADIAGNRRTRRGTARRKCWWTTPLPRRRCSSR